MRLGGGRGIGVKAATQQVWFPPHHHGGVGVHSHGNSIAHTHDDDRPADTAPPAPDPTSVVRLVVTTGASTVDTTWTGTPPPPGEVTAVLTSALGALSAPGRPQTPAGPVGAATAGPAGYGQAFGTGRVPTLGQPGA